MQSTRFDISTRYRGSTITIVAERMPIEGLWALQVRIDDDLLDHSTDDGGLWGRIVPRLLDDAIADIDAREDDNSRPDGGAELPQAA